MQGHGLAPAAVGVRGRLTRLWTPHSLLHRFEISVLQSLLDVCLGGVLREALSHMESVTDVQWRNKPECLLLGEERGASLVPAPRAALGCQGPQKPSLLLQMASNTFPYNLAVRLVILSC